MKARGSNGSKVRAGLMLIASLMISAGHGCKEAGNTDFQGRVLIKLVDAPAALEELNIVFRRVLIHRAGLSEDLGWRVVSDDVVTHDILVLRNGVSRVLVSAVVPEGSYDKLQVLFGVSSLRESGVDRTVDIPADILPGVVLEHSFLVEEGKTSGITFDFDATRSIKPGALGRYDLRPIIRVQNTDLAGSIIGAVVPDSIQTLVATTVGGDSVSTFSLAQTFNNSFELVDLPEGVYNVSLLPLDSRFRDTTLTNVTVVRRQKANLGAIVLRER